MFARIFVGNYSDVVFTLFNYMQGDDSGEGSKVRRRQHTPGSGKEAAAIRKLPESAATSPPPQPEQKEKPKKVGAI